MRYVHLLTLLSLGYGLVSCTRESAQSSRITIKTPASVANKTVLFNYGGQSTSQSVSAQNAGDEPEWNSLLNPSTVSEFNCYMVTISGPEANLQDNTCTTTESESFKIGMWKGGVPAGSAITLEVPSGPQRQIMVIGFKSQNGSCSDFKTTDIDDTNLSEPHIIGSVTQTLSVGNVTVNVPISLNASTKKLDTCNGPDFEFDTSNSLYFGDGMDGNFAGGVFNANHTWGITNKSVSGNQITFNVATDPTSGFTGSYLGREVMIRIASTDGNGCGQREPGVYYSAGMYGFARVIGYTASTITVEGASEFKNLDLSMGVNPTTSTFCLAQIAKVYNFNNVNLDNYFNAQGFNSSGGSGGIIALRVLGALTQSSIGAFYAYQTGFEGGVTSTIGSGTAGKHGGLNSGHATLSGWDNYHNGGVFSMSSGGGGGGNGGRGGNGASFTPLSGGGLFGESNLDNKLVMGGGGSGTNGFASGGGGGGIIYVAANNIILNTNFSIDTQGQPGAPTTNAGGGGAGGSVYLTYKNLNKGANTFSINANGGSGGSATLGGGGGGGGRIHVKYCSSAETVSSMLANGGAPGGGGTPSPGDNGTIFSEPVSCD